MHCARGGVYMKLAAFVPGLRFGLFSLHTVMPTFSVTLSVRQSPHAAWKCVSCAQGYKVLRVAH